MAKAWGFAPCLFLVQLVRALAALVVPSACPHSCVSVTAAGVLLMVVRMPMQAFWTTNAHTVEAIHRVEGYVIVAVMFTAITATSTFAFARILRVVEVGGHTRIPF